MGGGRVQSGGNSVKVLDRFLYSDDSAPAQVEIEKKENRTPCKRILVERVTISRFGYSNKRAIDFLEEWIKNPKRVRAPRKKISTKKTTNLRAPIPLYEKFAELVKEQGIKLAPGAAMRYVLESTEKYA